MSDFSLYPFVELIKGLVEAHESGDVPDEAFRDTLEGLQGDFEERAIACNALHREASAMAEAVKAEIARLKKIQDAHQHRADRLKAYIGYALPAAGLKKIDHPFLGMRVGNPSDILEILDSGLLPDEYVDVEIFTKPRKAEIKKAIKQGVDFGKAARIVEGKRPVTLTIVNKGEPNKHD